MQDFIYLVRLGDFVWNDLNGNGGQDVGEPGRHFRVSVTLTNTGSGAFTPTTTDANGKYLFTNLSPAPIL